MATVSTYLNFSNKTEEAFNFYKKIFGWDFEGWIMRYSDMPKQEKWMQVSDKEKNLVMHVSLPILGGHKLMWSDVPESMWEKIIMWNNIYISLAPDNRKETDKLFDALSDWWEVEMEPAEMFWWDYFASFKDKFWVKWMLNCSSKT